MSARRFSSLHEFIQFVFPGPTLGEKMALREEFLHTMQERFLSGQDKEFDYRFVARAVFYESLFTRCSMMSVCSQLLRLDTVYPHHNLKQFLVICSVQYVLAVASHLHNDSNQWRSEILMIKMRLK